MNDCDNGCSGSGYSHSRGGHGGCQVYQNGVRCGETKTLTIINEFKQLYEDKMRIIDQEGSGDCSMQAKISLQQDWIRDLTEQNEMLVRAVEELEQEATERVLALEEKLKQSSKCACEVMNGYRDFSINLEGIFQRNGMLENDVQSLMELLRRVREENSWSTEGLKFCTVNGDDLTKGFREPDRAPPDILPDDKTLKILEEKEIKITELQRELEKISRHTANCQDSVKDAQIATLKQSMLDMRDALTAEVADKHDTIVMLRRDVQLLEDQCRKADQQTHFKDDIIKELRKELKQLKAAEKSRDLKEKIKCLEEENEELRLAIKRTTEELDSLNDLMKKSAAEKEVCCRKYEDRISCLIAEHMDECTKLQDCCRRYENQLENLSSEKMKIMCDFECCSEEYRRKEREYSDNCCMLEEKLKVSGDTIYKLELEVSKISNDNQEHCCTIKRMQVKIEELTAECCKPSTSRAIGTEHCSRANKALNTAKCDCVDQKVQVHFDEFTATAWIETDRFKQSDKSLNTMCNCVDQSTQSRFVNFEEAFDDFYDVNVVKPVPAHFSSQSTMNCSDGRHKKMEYLEKDYEVEEAKRRICELEEELHQAWTEKEKEVETARCCREQEIINLKEVINSLMKSLDNERQRSENHQKAVDLYLNSISVLQDTEEQLKKEISDQRVTISNLQDVLVSTKHTLEEHRQKANQDVGLGWAARWFGVAPSEPNKTNNSSTNNNNKPVHDV